ncbi:head GIN domain-containing protein [Undibacterium arcticum]|uniref:Head GIN domain-containing protein n=1 Tax=Undibacterium arcticum TaxID=1762892 RepID=A0ABV7EZD7_9BURK
MQTLVKIGVSLTVVAAVLVGACYNVLLAQGVSHPPISAAERVIATETRPLGAGIVNIDLNGPVDLKLVQGNSPSMTVRAEKRLLPQITTEQDGNTLHIGLKGFNIHTRRPLQVELTLPALQQLTMQGSGDADVKGFNGEQLQLALRGSGNAVVVGQYKRINASILGSGDLQLNGGNSDHVELSLTGSGEMTITGQSKALAAKIMGSGNIDASRLPSDSVKLDLLGSGDASLNAKQSVNLNLRGSGDIHVDGKPAQRNVSRTGSGDVSFE